MFVATVLLLLLVALGWIYWGWIGAVVIFVITLILITLAMAAKIPETLIYDVAERIGLDPKELYVLALIESNLDPDAKNGDAIGIMQVRPIALEDVNSRYDLNYTVWDLKDPEINLLVGGLYYKTLKDYFSYYSPYTAGVLAVIAYNWGMGNTLKLLKGEIKPEDIPAQIPTETAYHALKYVFLLNALQYGR